MPGPGRRSKFGEIIAARSMGADTRKQQIPPLRSGRDDDDFNNSDTTH